jgi:peroxiredoxin
MAPITPAPMALPDLRSAGVPAVLFLFETDCPTCRLASPYLSRLAEAAGPLARIIGLSQDPEDPTAAFARQTGAKFEIWRDEGFPYSRELDPGFVPAWYVFDAKGQLIQHWVGFDKAELNTAAAGLGLPAVASDSDGNPPSKPGCTSRHREGPDAGVGVETAVPEAGRASQIELAQGVDPWEYCRGWDPLPVVPPTRERVERMIGDRDSGELIALVPPNFGPATVEKIAANAVMAGCDPAMMRVLIPLIRAVCDERFNLHGVQATTHFACPLVILNGPIRTELGFASGSNVFSNVARANSTLGRALQLILSLIGGAKPGEIDMSALGNPGKFSYVIAENEERSPWTPLASGNAITLFAGAPPAGFSEHRARDARTLLRAFTRVLETTWSPRLCGMVEAFVVVCPEHAATLARDGFSKEDVRQHLFENTGVPLREFDDDGEGTQFQQLYTRVTIRGEECYRKFAAPEQIQIVVAGGTAGKFSAVISGWQSGPRGSQSVTYRI